MAHTIARLKSRLFVLLAIAVTSGIALSGIATDTAVAATVSPASVSIAGDTPVGSVLTATISGAWDPADATPSYQWKRGASAISGAVASTYTTVAADIGLSISVDVMAEAAGYDPVTISSNVISPRGVFTTSGKPVISRVVSGAGSFVVGQLITASTDVFTPSATSVTYEWRRNSTAISSATSAQYQLVEADAGQNISVIVTGSLAMYSDLGIESDPITPIGVYTVTPVPTITGTTSVGGVLNANPGSWTSTPTSFEYQWLRDAAEIGTATGSTYTVVAADFGTNLSVRVTAKRTGFTDASQTSVATALIAKGDFTSVGSVSIDHTGSAVGDTLTAAVTGWAPTPGSYDYQWFRDGASISGATSASYDLVDADQGFAITVRATAQRSGYNASASLSSAVNIARGSFVVDARPEISDANAGTQFAVGHVVTSNTGTFTPTPTSYGYQWNRNGNPISGAISSSYTLVAADAGASITVTVTAQHRNRTDEPSESLAVTGVGQFTATPVPTISGTQQVDHTLTANVSGWTPTPTSYTYAWYRDDSISVVGTSQTLDLTHADLNHSFTVRVTAVRTGYESVSSDSSVTGLIATTWFTSTGTATIDASTKQLADVLTVTLAGWAPDPDSYTYRWLRNGTSISGATNSSYEITEADLGNSVSVRVTPVRAGYSTASPSVLSQTMDIPLASFVTTGSPVITGTATIPNILTVSSVGVFSPATTSTQIQWLRNGAVISGATSNTYQLVAADSGKNISARVTGIRAGYTNSTLTSDATAVSVASRFTVSPNPTIDGVPQVGRTLTARPGAWLPTPTSFSYQWVKNGTSIPGGTASTYDLVAADVGAVISVVVQPILDNHIPIVRTSRATVSVSAATFGATRPAPTITGVQKVGQVLTAQLSGWTPDPTTVSFQWLRNGASISGATLATYTLTSDDLGKKISVVATATKVAYAAAQATSLGTGLIAQGEFSDTPTPTISGTVSQGNTLTASADIWTPTATLTYSWKRGGAAISGATSRTYQVSSADAGLALTVSVTGSRSGFLPVTVTSASTVVVPSLSFSDTANPVILGDAEVGGTLSVDYGTPSPTPVTVSYQWLRNDVDIAEATDATYTPTVDDLYSEITVAVAVNRIGYSEWTETSDDSVNVAEGNLGLLSSPVVTGTPRVGRTLTATFGTWDVDADTFTYQWFRDGTGLGVAQTISEASATVVTYALTSADVGGVITFGVVASKDGYADEQASSVDTAAIGLSAFNTRPVPTITGVAKVANTLTAVTGSWSPNPSSYTYQWTRDAVNIDLATAPTYVVAPEDAGHVIRVVVNGVRAGYEGQPATSQPTVSVANAAFTSTPVPTISGTIRVGVTVSAVTSTWNPVATTSTFVWKRNGTPIAGATGPTYEIVAADLGATLSVVQTGSAMGYSATPIPSASTVAVVKGVFSTQPTPQITGRARIGTTLLASSASWQPAATTLTYQWQRAGQNISGAVASSYVIQPIDGGSPITVSVTASRTAYDSVTKVSAATAAVEYLAFTDTVLPTISGTEKVEGVLTASTGDWTPTPTTFTYQWKRTVSSVTTVISGATNATYTLVGADAGATISVSVTGTKLGYAPVTQTSDTSDVIANGTLSLTPSPTLSGVPQVGVAFALGAGTWSPSPVQLAYQWLLDDVEITGATSATYTPIAGDVVGRLSVRVTGSKLGYDPVSQTSAKTSAVILGVFSAPVPTIAGAAKVGTVLTATPGTWTPATSPGRTYQWKKTVSGVTTNISGETGLTYTPVAADVGATISFAASGGLDGYVSLTKISAATLAVVKGTFSAPPTPLISGATTPSRVGQQLSVSVGHWTPQETGVTYQWKRDGVAISGATGTTYDTQAADLNKSVTVTATATLAGYVDGSSTSAARVISAGIFGTSSTPTISGFMAVGATLTADPGSWAPDATFTYQWKRAGTAISGAIASTYVLRPEDADRVVSVVVTGSRAGYTSISLPSADTATVARIAFTAAPEPVISGTAAVGQTLTASAGTWTPSSVASPIALTYRWEKGGNTIAGATSSTYLVLPGDETSKIRVYVTGTKLGYITQEQPSAETSAVVKGTLTTTPKPTITGTAQVGVQLTAVPGTWQPTVAASPITFDYQWKSDGTNISGATNATYTPVVADLGKAISVTVTGKKTGYTSVPQTSDALARLVTIAGTFGTIPKPTITGGSTAKVGVELTAVAGTWVPAAGSLAYQWKRTAGATTTNISGATTQNYTPTADDQGKTLSVVVTATTTGYATTASQASTATASVALGTFATPSTLPAISGTVQVNETLSASEGSTWPVGAALSYKWNRNGVAISAAQVATYRLVTADVGARITVTVTGTVTGYAAQSITSTQTIAVVASAPGAPTSLTSSSVTATSAVIRWTAPTDTGGAAISDYKVEYSSDGGSTWSVFSHAASTVTSITLTGLTTATSYKIRVSTKNAIGFSTPSTVLSVTTL